MEVDADEKAPMIRDDLPDPITHRQTSSNCTISTNNSGSGLPPEQTETAHLPEYLRDFPWADVVTREQVRQWRAQGAPLKVVFNNVVLARNRYKALRYFIEEGYDVDDVALTKKKYTLFHVFYDGWIDRFYPFTNWNRYRLADTPALLSMGPSTDRTSYEGWTALHQACWRYRKSKDERELYDNHRPSSAQKRRKHNGVYDVLIMKYIKMLIKYGFSITQKDNDGHSPMDMLRGTSEGLPD